jgi:hypothetical protein
MCFIGTTLRNKWDKWTNICTRNRRQYINHRSHQRKNVTCLPHTHTHTHTCKPMVAMLERDTKMQWLWEDQRMWHVWLEKRSISVRFKPTWHTQDNSWTNLLRWGLHYHCRTHWILVLVVPFSPFFTERSNQILTDFVKNGQLFRKCVHDIKYRHH